MKKTFDKAVATSILVASAPLVIAASVAVRLTMGGPVFFSQVRPGYQGKPFRIYKMRTMTNARDDEGRLLPDAERLTRVGRLLRATSMDELPQLYNVVCGEMSLVGPRPLLTEYLALYSPAQARRHDVLPGITGWAAIHGRNTRAWNDKFEMDTWYVDNWSLQLDLQILAATVRTVMQRDGVTREGHATMPFFRGQDES